jgi:K(+)-stimulated pyrophosphate-energized sodium pump
MYICKKLKVMKRWMFAVIGLVAPLLMKASEASLVVPDGIKDEKLLYWGFLIIALGLLFALYKYLSVKKLPAHRSMLEVADVIYQTAKTYLIKQGKFLLLLFVLIGAAVAFYFGYLTENSFGIGGVLMILGWTIVGMLGSYTVAWFGIRMNTYSNARMAFYSLMRKPYRLLDIPVSAGMSIGVMLISIELTIMLIILLLLPGQYAGPSFIGFAIGESLGAAALRIAGGIFTKIADIGSDLMKVIFKIGDDDPRNPGTIADCVGDNAGDSVGPTADGFETYGVTGVALISFILLGVHDPNVQVKLLMWIFVMRILMIVTSLFAYWINSWVTKARFAQKDFFDFEKPLNSLVWTTSILSIIVTYVASYFMLRDMGENIWWILSTIISAGTLGAALIPELTKIFTSHNFPFVREIVESSKRGGSSLNILSGFVTGNYSAFWQGVVFVLLMVIAYVASTFGLDEYMVYPSIFAFGLVAFGMLGMGPVTIAVDSYGPVTDNAQSIYELSLIESNPNAKEEIEKEFGFTPDFELSKYYLEAGDGTGNTFKATAKPVLIGTAVVGATTMIFSLILLVEKALGVDPMSLLSILNPYTLFGFILGGAVIYWFTSAANQAVTTGAGRAVQFIKKNINLDPNAEKKASTEKSQQVVSICTRYAQQGMINIFLGIFSFALGIAFLSSPGVNGNVAAVSMFISYLISIAIFGLYQAIFMANGGGAWDNAKKVVEVELKAKGTDLHAATITGDTVGDPFKDTASVSLNPIIKFTTLFGLLAMEIAISPAFLSYSYVIGAIFLVIAIYFVYRTFYKMRVPKDDQE